MLRKATVPAFAKINLALKVLYRRPDGYHELRTIFQTISLHDTIGIEFRRARRTSLSLEGNVDIPDNLILRAARAVLGRMKLNAEVRFTLEKRIPMGGGLGGGSSDAAAALLALPALAGKPVPLDELTAMAASLGSDVPFFLMGGTALGLGRGEELYPFPEPKPSPGLLVVPDIHVSTPEAYRALARPLTPASPSRNTNTFRSFGWMAGEGLPLDGWFRFCQNDFEEVVFTGYPRIQTLKRKLWKLGARPAMLTGSGAGVFGFFPAPGLARQAALQFPREKAFLFDLVSRARYRSLWRRALGQDKDDAAWPPRSSHAG